MSRGAGSGPRSAIPVSAGSALRGPGRGHDDRRRHERVLGRGRRDLRLGPLGVGRPDREGAPAPTLLVLGDDPVDDRGERRHLEQCQPDADATQVVGRVAAIQATTGDRAHLVVQLGPADAPSSVAEANEVDGLWLALVGRWGVPGVQRQFVDSSIPYPPDSRMPNRTRLTGEIAARGDVPVGVLDDRLRPSREALGRRGGQC